jgi:hypothetical protein
MNKYMQLYEILIVKDGIEVSVPINYKELSLIHYHREGLKGQALARKLQLAMSTVYNTIRMLKIKLRVKTLKELKSLFQHLNIRQLLGW